jgi:hypothetical protein
MNPEKRSVFQLPALPSGARIDRSNLRQSQFMVVLWRAWLNIAADHASLAQARKTSPAVVDAFSRNLHGDEDFPVPEGSTDEESEAEAAMIAITAAAFAIDGFYGTVKALVRPSPSKAARQRQIVECLKHGFEVGAKARRWQEDLDWLFAIRDNSVHHSEVWEEMVVVDETDQTIAYGGKSTFNFSAANASRAYEISRDIIRWCLLNPKQNTEAWARSALSRPGTEG